MIGQRSVLFLVAAVVCVALIPLSESDLRWVPMVVAVVYVVLAVVSALDSISRSRD